MACSTAIRKKRRREKKGEKEEKRKKKEKISPILLTLPLLLLIMLVPGCRKKPVREKIRCYVANSARNMLPHPVVQNHLKQLKMDLILVLVLHLLTCSTRSQSSSAPIHTDDASGYIRRICMCKI